jgi:DNA helicase-2/ATP-dependent DNA helicase PcrA
LYAERSFVRETAKRNLYTGKTYNSVENISNFFAERGMPPPSGLQRPAASAPPASSSAAGVNTSRPPAPSGPSSSPPPPRPPQNQQQSLYPQEQPPRPSAPPKPAAAAVRPSSTAKKPAGIGAGATIRHPKYGRGTVLRREGDGDDAKLTVSFPGYGLKKLIEKFAGIREE